MTARTSSSSAPTWARKSSPATGNDFIYGNKNAERILGNEGNDWIETGTFDGAPGDNFDEIFAHDGIDGHDVFLGDGGFDEFIGEGGDDIMVGSAGRGKMVGMSGFDWATYKDNPIGVNADLSIPIIFDEAPTLPQNAALDEYESMEGLSGTRFNDVLTGTQRRGRGRAPARSRRHRRAICGSVLDAEGIALIKGLQEVLGAGVTTFDALATSSSAATAATASRAMPATTSSTATSGSTCRSASSPPVIPSTPARRSRCTTA